MDCYVRQLIHGHARDGGSSDCKMQEVHPHESRCLRRHQYRLIFIPSTLSCGIGSGPDTLHQTQHSSPLTRPSIFPLLRPDLMRDRKRRSKTKNGVFRSGFFDQKRKSYLMRSDFGDFRAAFFDLAFSIATSYRNGGDFRSEKWRSKNTARLDTKACVRPTHKNQ